MRLIRTLGGTVVSFSIYVGDVVVLAAETIGAAVTGGVYLFCRGVVRVARGRILGFELTRRLLAYLFRRDLSKKARETHSQGYVPLSADTFRALGPESRTPGQVRSAADAPVKEIIERIKAARGGSIAIVGERGSGKTTLIERITAGCTGLVSVTSDTPIG